MKLDKWSVSQDLKATTDKHYRTAFALALKDKEPWEIVSRLTFDSVAPKLTLLEVEDLFAWVDKKVLGGNLKGVGLELGGGAGFMSAVLATFPPVEKVYNVEVVENVVRELGPKIVNYVLEKKSDKVIGCIGEFDNLQLPANSVDFIFDFYSLHHSLNLVKTITESARVLKPGGFVLCFDKARDNNLTLADLDGLLDKEYDHASKILMGLPADVSHTRRQNGEQEYRLKDWGQAFHAGGLSNVEHYHLARITGGKVGRLLKKVISLLPVNFQTVITSRLYKNKKVNNLEISHLVFCPPIKNFPKEISLLVAYKK